MMSTMRLAAPDQVQHIWDVISDAREGKEKIWSINFECLINQLTSTKKLQKDEINRELECAVKDALVFSGMFHPQGAEPKHIYMLPVPDGEFSKGDHDWYCFHCHMSDEGSAVVSCEACPRIFHLKCLTGVAHQLHPQEGKFVCPICKMLEKNPSADVLNISREKLNKVLEFSCAPIKNWDIPFMNSSDGVTWALVSGRKVDEKWRYKYLVYFNMNLTNMLEKAKNQKYSSLEEYQVDCDTLMHSIQVYFGNSVLERNEFPADCYKDITRDIEDIKLCHDCFRLSNEKNQPWWFCIPCTKPHALVWAKRSGFPFWPAKVMKTDGSEYEVRSFGGKHERGVIDVKYIKPIEIPIDQLDLSNPSTAWNAAFDELKKFQEIALNPQVQSTFPSNKPQAEKITMASLPKKNSTYSIRSKASPMKCRASIGTGTTKKVETTTTLNSDGDSHGAGQSPRSVRYRSKSTTNASNPTVTVLPDPGSCNAPESERVPAKKMKTTSAL